MEIHKIPVPVTTIQIIQSIQSSSAASRTASRTPPVTSGLSASVRSPLSRNSKRLIKSWYSNLGWPRTVNDRPPRRCGFELF